MTKDELTARLQDHEDNFVERKSDGVTAEKIRKTVSAFANTVEGRSAVLFIGIDDISGAIQGVQKSDALQKRIRVALEECYPPIGYTCEVLEADGKHVVAVVIPPSTNRPHFTGSAFIRVGSESVKASPQQFNELILSRDDIRRQILSHKGRGLVSVRGVGYKLHSKQSVAAGSAYIEHTECLIEDCTAYDVKFCEPATGRTFSASLKGIVLGRDDKKLDRFMVLVYPPRP